MVAATVYLFPATPALSQRTWATADRPRGAAPDAQFGLGHHGHHTDDAETPDAPRRAYYDYIQEALDAFNGKRWKAARAAFEAAHALDPSARTLRGVGLSAYYSADWVGAAAAMRAALHTRHKPLTPEQREQLTAFLRDANQHIGRLNVDVFPPESQVLIDGRPVVLVTGQPLPLQPGEYGLEARCPGYRPQTRPIILEPGAQVTVVLSLEPAAVDRETHPTIPTSPATSPGRSALSEPDEEHAASSRKRRVWTWVAAAGAAAMVGASAATWRLAQRRLAGIRGDCTRDDCSEDDKTERIEQANLLRLQTWSNTTLAGAAVLASSGVALYFIEGRGVRENGPAVQLGLGGIRLTKRF